VTLLVSGSTACIVEMDQLIIVEYRMILTSDALKLIIRFISDMRLSRAWKSGILNQNVFAVTSSEVTSYEIAQNCRHSC
jgi:hypothetical protein